MRTKARTWLSLVVTVSVFAVERIILQSYRDKIMTKQLPSMPKTYCDPEIGRSS